MGNYTEEIIRNAERINQLKKRIDETVKTRNKNDQKRKEWQKACADFHSSYDALAFPGGFSNAYERILSGEQQAIEAALCFIECRPYFFRKSRNEVETSLRLFFVYKRVLKSS
jgi:DNA repair exonuclease SbcCD ATPase subunit